MTANFDLTARKMQVPHFRAVMSPSLHESEYVSGSMKILAPDRDSLKQIHNNSLCRERGNNNWPRSALWSFACSEEEDDYSCHCKSPRETTTNCCEGEECKSVLNKRRVIPVLLKFMRC